MTGLDRLRGYARRMDELHVWPGGARLREIADQIGREHDAEVADSPYDAILPEDREAAAWVRDHGELDSVKEEWSSRVPYDKHEQRRQRLLGHIAECETALRRRNARIEWLGHRVGDLTRENAELRRRAMPEGMEWPRFEDGEPVHIGDSAPFGTDDVMEVVGVEINRFGYVLHGSINDGMRECVDGDEHGVAVKRPEPKVLAADGEPLEVGQTVWDVDDGTELTITSVELDRLDHVKANQEKPTKASVSIHPSRLTHERPVLDADGVPIKVGDTVYEVGKNYPPFIVGRLPEPCAYRSVRVVYPSGAFTSLDPERLTHTKPEPPDSWERIEEGALSFVEDNAGIPHDQDQMERDMLAILRRCRELAERGE